MVVEQSSSAAAALAAGSLTSVPQVRCRCGSSGDYERSVKRGATYFLNAPLAGVERGRITSPSNFPNNSKSKDSVDYAKH